MQLNKLYEFWMHDDARQSELVGRTQPLRDIHGVSFDTPMWRHLARPVECERKPV